MWTFYSNGALPHFITVTHWIVVMVRIILNTHYFIYRIQDSDSMVVCDGDGQEKFNLLLAIWQCYCGNWCKWCHEPLWLAYDDGYKCTQAIYHDKYWMGSSDIFTRNYNLWMAKIGDTDWMDHFQERHTSLPSCHYLHWEVDFTRNHSMPYDTQQSSVM